jgi:DNA-binding protein H-NS
MTRRDLDELSVEELWALRERITVDLASRLIAEKTKLELRLKEIRGGDGKQSEAAKERRPYPKVFPKFRNPDRPSETWAGRGKQPRWLTAQLRTGKQMDDFLIERAARIRA